MSEITLADEVSSQQGEQDRINSVYFLNDKNFAKPEKNLIKKMLLFHQAFYAKSFITD